MKALKSTARFFLDIAPAYLTLAIMAAFAAMWITHVIVSIQQQLWVLLVVGAFVFPIGITHGLGIWVGLF